MDPIPRQIVPVDAELADAAFVAFTRYGKGQPPAALNFEDCFSCALARVRSVPLLFKGHDFSRTDVQAAQLEIIDAGKIRFSRLGAFRLLRCKPRIHRPIADGRI